MSERIFGMRRGFAIFILIVLYTLAPILSVLLASLIANALGCRLDEGQAHPCPCLGVDIGEPLTVMFVAGWLALITLPTGLLAMIGYMILAAMSKIWR
jgi:hypothetical protein